MEKNKKQAIFNGKTYPILPVDPAFAKKLGYREIENNGCYIMYENEQKDKFLAPLIHVMLIFQKDGKIYGTNIQERIEALDFVDTILARRGEPYTGGIVMKILEGTEEMSFCREYTNGNSHSAWKKINH